jgi:hypothetical protein
MPNNTSYSFDVASTSDLNTELALIDLGGADAGTANTYTFNFTQSVTLTQSVRFSISSARRRPLVSRRQRLPSFHCLPELEFPPRDTATIPTPWDPAGREAGLPFR